MLILVDIDGTMRHTWPRVNAHILEATGVKLPDVWQEYDVARRTVGDEAANAAFEAVCGDYDLSDWYPGAWSAMVELRRNGLDPVFCTVNPYRRARTIARKLAPLYGMPPHVERVESAHNKLKVAKRLGAVGIIDDKPSTLEAFNAAGYFTATYDHPYNRHVQVDYRFFDWSEVYLVQAIYSSVWWQLRFESEAMCLT